MIDTHAHLYDSQFDSDRTVMIQRSIDQGVNKIFLPNTDVDSVEGMMALQKQFPENCFPMIGLHPCDVKEDYLSQLEKLYEWLKKYKFYAIGEIGMDLHWDSTFVDQQKKSP